MTFYFLLTPSLWDDSPLVDGACSTNLKIIVSAEKSASFYI